MPDSGSEKQAAAPRSAANRPAVARSAARLGAVQALYQMDIGGTDMAEVLAQYGGGRLGDDFNEGQCGEADAGFLKSIVEGVVVTDQGTDRPQGE
jgi:N utilization substance protein B